MVGELKDGLLFQSVFESSLEGILIVDGKQNILNANASAGKMFGYSSQQLANQKLNSLIIGKFEIHIKNATKQSKRIYLDEKHGLFGLRKDGSKFSLNINLISSEVEGKPVVIIFFVNKTQRHSVKSDMKESEKTAFEFLQKTAHIGTWFWNIKTNERSWSDESYRILGLPPGDKRLNPETVFGFIHPEDKADTLQAFSYAIENRILYSFENRIVRPNGEIRYVLGSGKTTYDVNENPETMFGSMQDITDQKIREKKLKQSEARSTAFLKTLPDLISVMDKYGNVLQINESQHIPFFGTAEEVVGRNVAEIVPAPAGPQFVRALAKAHRSRKLIIEEMSYLHDGMQFTFEVRVIPMVDGNLMNIARNITDQKISELQLLEKEAKNKAILQAIPDLMVVFNSQGVYLDAQAPDTILLPIPVNKLIGGNLRDFMPDEVSDKFFRAFANVQKTGRPRTTEYSLQVIDDIRYYEARIVEKGNGNFLAIIRDITTKKIKDDILFVRNRALAVASSGIVIVDARQPDLPMIYANTTFLKLVGYDEDEILGKNCRFLQNKDKDQEGILMMRHAINEGLPCKVTLRNYRKDGTLFYNELTITPIKNKKNELTHFIGVQNDVTDRKREEFLKDNIRDILEMITQRTALESTADKIVATMEGQVENGMASILLFNDKQRTLHVLNAPNLPKNFSKEVEGYAIGPKAGSCGTAAYLKEAVIVENIAESPLWVDIQKLAKTFNLEACWSYPILSSNMEVLGTFAVYFNEPKKPLEREKEVIADMAKLASITIEQHNVSLSLEKKNEELEGYANKLEEKVQERTDELKATVQKMVETNFSLQDQMEETKKAETKLVENQKLFSAIARKFPKGIITVFNQDHRILYSEGGGKETIGLQNYPFIGKTIDEIDVFPDETKTLFKKCIEETLTGKHLTFERVVNDVTFTVNTMPLGDDANEITRVLLVHNDISERKKVEEDMLIALHKEQELNELKSRFVSLASHEFRTPLSTILSAAGLIETLNDPGYEDKRLGYVNRIKSGVKGLVVILNDFLSLSQLEEGKVIFKPEHFDILEFTKDLVDELANNKKENQKIFIHDNCDSAQVYLDPKLLRHILHNLLSNAIKYSPENKNIEITITTKAKQLSIEVRDYGIGIPKEEQENLFNRFFRANNASHIQGTGLGLNIVKQYTELMEGTINFESNPNEGSTFLVELPLKPHMK